VTRRKDKWMGLPTLEWTHLDRRTQTDSRHERCRSQYFHTNKHGASTVHENSSRDICRLSITCLYGQLPT
jgi:hypothetical protein